MGLFSSIFEWFSPIRRYTAGTTNSVNNVSMAIPVAIISPMLKRDKAPAPVAKIRGKTPNTISAIVIKMSKPDGGGRFYRFTLNKFIINLVGINQALLKRGIRR
jgi:hypothetical protein